MKPPRTVKGKRKAADTLLPLYPTLHGGHSGQLAGKLVVVCFSGFGGADVGIEQALGRPADFAINHWRDAIAVHQRNHPYTKHFVEDIWDVDPREVTKGQPIAVLWASPDCTHFSKAKGGQPRSKKIRGLAWSILRWASMENKPECIFLENVEEFQDWGPLLADGKPCPKQKGRTFRSFINALKKHGYQVEWKELRACDYGAPTTRKRLFLIARSDGKAIEWPEPTHGKPGSEAVATGQLQAWRTAAECIDWSLPCKSIFDRKKPLAENTQRRIFRGLEKFVFKNPTPFIVSYYGQKGNEFRGADLESPLPTQTTENRFGLITPYMVRTDMHQSNAGCAYPPENPLNTITTTGGHAVATPVLVPIDNGSGGGSTWSTEHPLTTVVTENRHALVLGFLNKHYTGVIGSELSGPLHTITTADHHTLTAAFFDRQFGNGRAAGCDEPLRTITTEGAGKSALVKAFLMKYYGAEKDGHSVDGPLGTVTTKHKFGLVTVEGQDYQIADIGLRMLEPRELIRAQGFPETFCIDMTIGGKKLTKESQVRMIGNSVCPPVARALVEAQFGISRMQQEAAD